MEIRLMGMEDYQAVYGLWLATPGMGLNTVDDSEEGIRKFLARNPTTCFVAEEDGAILGVILGGHDGRRGYLHHLAVAEAAKYRGIGSALVDRVMEALDGEGICKVHLVVFADNTGGNAFWERLGFPTREDLVFRDKSIRELTRIVRS